jgi:hypothetical protein
VVKGGGTVDDHIKLDSHHRATVSKVFGHPVSHNVEWHDVRSLLEAVGQVIDGKGGHLKVTLGGEMGSFEPRGAVLNEQQVVDVRTLLRQAGITPERAAER